MRFHVLNFGCQMNVADGQWLSQTLSSQGWTLSTEEEAQVILVTTCSVREKPEQKVYSLLGRLQSYVEKTPDLFVAVGGCVAQQIGTGFWDRFPFVRLVFGTDGTAMVPKALERLVVDPQLRISLLDFLDYYPERTLTKNGAVGAQALVNIMQGCDNFCTYCIVPFTRGRQKSRSAEAIVTECALLISRGARQLTLLGQNVNSYGQDKHGDGTSFAELLQQISALPGLERLNFITSHPKDIADQVVEAFGTLPNLSPQLHLPLQSGSNAVLKAMGRKYTKEHYLEIIHALRCACPHIALTTDLIVGFPGETRSDFKETLDLVRQIRFVSSFSFKYSDRPGVRAEKMPGKILEEEKSSRLLALQELQDQITVQELERMVGQQTQVLVEGQSKVQEGDQVFWRGRDPGGRIVNFASSSPDLVGKMVPVRILEAKKHSLVGEVRGEPW